MLQWPDFVSHSLTLSRSDRDRINLGEWLGGLKDGLCASVHDGKDDWIVLKTTRKIRLITTITTTYHMAAIFSSMTSFRATVYYGLWMGRCGEGRSPYLRRRLRVRTRFPDIFLLSGCEQSHPSPPSSPFGWRRFVENCQKLILMEACSHLHPPCFHRLPCCPFCQRNVTSAFLAARGCVARQGG